MATEFKRTLALNSEGGILRDEHDRYVMLDGAQSVIQELKITLKTIRGEDPFDPDHGLRLFDVIGAPDEVLEREVRSALKRDDRVQSVEEVHISSEPGSREREVEIEVELVDVDDDIEFGVRFG